MNKFSIDYHNCDTIGTHIYISKNNQYIGNIVIRDKIKENSSVVYKIRNQMRNLTNKFKVMQNNCCIIL